MNSGVAILIVYLLLALFYFIPTFVAFQRHHPNRWVIFGINLALGGTGIGWIGSLIWAFQAVHLSEHGTDGGESGLNIFANDPVNVRIDGEPVIRAKPMPEDDPATQLAKLKRLRDEGVIDEVEYQRMRKPHLEAFGRSS